MIYAAITLAIAVPAAVALEWANYRWKKKEEEQWDEWFGRDRDRTHR